MTKIGDGKNFVSPVESPLRICTEEVGGDAA